MILFSILGLVINCYHFNKILDEKQSKLLYYQITSGITYTQYIVTDIFYYQLLLLYFVLVNAIFTHFFLFKRTNFFLIFLIFYNVFFEKFAICYLLVAIFSNKKSAIMVLGVLLFFQIAITFIFQAEFNSKAVNALLTIASPIYGLKNVLTNLNESNLSLSDSGFHQMFLPYLNYSYYFIALTPFFVYLLILLISIYLFIVIPNEYGTNKHFLFMF